MHVPSPFNLLAVIALAVVTFAAPAFACVCADGTTTTQPFTHFCDGNDGKADEPCEEGCEVTRLADEVAAPGERASVPMPPQVHLALPAWSTVAEVTSANLWSFAAVDRLAPPDGANAQLRCVILIV